jgi:hypothetical protein
MKSSVALLVAASALLASSGAYARGGVPIVNFENVQVVTGTGKPVDADAVKKAITSAATSRGWTIEAVERDKLQATYNVNRHSIMVDISYAPASYSIRYAESLSMNYEMTGAQPTIHPRYNAWVKDLKLAIDTALARSTDAPVRIGVAMTAVPKVTIQVPGAGCVLCVATAEATMSSLKEHLGTLPSEDLPKLKAEVADLLRKQGLEVVVIPDDLDLNALPQPATRARKIAKKDFSSLMQKYGIDKLALIEITHLGVTRNFSAYVPTSDPKAVLNGFGYIVNLSDNTYQATMPVNITKAAGGSWDEPPRYPGMTNAYFQMLELARERFLQTISSNSP